MDRATFGGSLEEMLANIPTEAGQPIIFTKKYESVVGK